MHSAWNHNTYYHPIVLKAVPSPCALAIDIGCGEGGLTFKLAALCDSVIGLDLDLATLPANANHANISFIAADVMTYPVPLQHFDFVTAVATLHHLPLNAALHRFKDMLKPGGVLVIIGLYKMETLMDFAYAGIAMPVSRTLRLFSGYHPGKAQLATPTQTLAAIKTAAKLILPGAVIKRHLLFRYSLTWRKPL